MTDTPIADQAASAPGHLRLWDATTNEFLWSSDTPRELAQPLVEVLAAAGGRWVLATYDYAPRGRVWAGRMRLGETGDIEARPEYEFLTVIAIPANPALAPEGGSTL